MNEQRTFGIEIEIQHSDARAMAAALTAAGIETRTESYNHSTRAHWKIVSDASVHGGYELVSPILCGQEGLEQVRTVSRVLIEQGARVNKTCGFHVHHDAHDFKQKNFQNLFNLYQRSEHLIDAMMPVSRRGNNNRYCWSLQVLQSIPSNRYFKVNFQAFHVHGTVEFRQHSGTIEAEKMIQWILITQAVVERSKRQVKTGARLTQYDLFQALGMIHNPSEEQQSMKSYIERRTAALA